MAKIQAMWLNDRINCGEFSMEVKLFSKEEFSYGDIRDYIEAYEPGKPKVDEPGKPLIEFVEDKTDIVDQLVMYYNDIPISFISLREDGTFAISDDFAEAIKAKIMPKVDVLESDFESWSESDVYTNEQYAKRRCEVAIKNHEKLEKIRGILDLRIPDTLLLQNSIKKILDE